jgi:non-ribosomal peptide synthetase component E (peptide arylation enzyme)
MSIISAFAKVAAEQPQTIAMITERSQLTYQDILDLVHLIDMELATRGVRPEQTLVLDTARGEFTMAFTLLLSLRGYRVAFTSVKQAQLGGLAFDRAIVTEATDLIDQSKQIVIENSWFRTLGTLATPDYSTHTMVDGGGIFITQTSGSTGMPKYVIGGEAERLKTVNVSAGFVNLSMKGRRFTTTLAPNTGWAVSAALSVLLSGGSVVLVASDREKILSFIDLYRVDALATTPAILSQMLKLPDAKHFIASLRDIRIGGALAVEQLIQQVAELSDATLHIGYGASEIGMMLGYRHNPENHRPSGYLGHPVRDDLEIGFYDDTGRLMPDADEGLVGFRFTDPLMQRQYLNENDNDVAGLKQGVFFPGDVLKRTADGYQYVDRLKNIVNFGGNKYSIERVTEYLSEQFKGAQFVAFVDRNEHGLEQLLLVQSGGETIDRHEAEATLKPSFAGVSIAAVKSVESFPVNPQTGKVAVESLRKLFSED